MPSLALDDAEEELAELPGTFFSTSAAAEQLDLSLGEARSLLAKMEAASLALRVCRDGWVSTWRCGSGVRTAPTLIAYLDDMMRHLKVGYYISYESAAELRGVARRRVSRHRVHVEVDDDITMDALELRAAYGPGDSVVRFHRIDPGHGRPVAIVGRLYQPPGGGGDAAKIESRCVQVATAETTLLDMMESPERSGGMETIAVIARAMLWEHSLHRRLLAEAASRYPPQVAQRAGSILEQLRGRKHWISLRPLMRHVRSTRSWHPVAMHDGYAQCRGKPDRWGVIHPQQHDPDYWLSKYLPQWYPGRQAAPPWLQRLMMRRVPRWRRAIRRPERCRSLASPISDRGYGIRTVPDAGFGLTDRG